MSAKSRLLVSLCVAATACGGSGSGEQRGPLTGLPTFIAGAKGRLTGVGTSSVQRVIAYDPLGRVSGETYALEGHVYTYAHAYGYPTREAQSGELGSVLVRSTLPAGQGTSEVVSRGYDAGGQPQAMSAGGAPIVTAVRRNVRGQTTQLSYGNGVVSQRRYDDPGDLRLKQLVTAHAGTTLAAQSYVTDDVGNVTQVNDYCSVLGECCDPTSTSCPPKAMSAFYGYDARNRLTVMLGTVDGSSRTWSYDAIDNLVTKEDVAQSFNAGGKPHALLARGSEPARSYDANGNLMSTGTLSLTWNSENMPISVSGAAGVLLSKRFLGEAMWKKVEDGATTYYLPGIEDESGQLRRHYDQLAERDGAGTLRYVHADHLGSSTLVTDSSGNVVHRAAYLPFGGERLASGPFTPRYQFTWKEKEAKTGLYDFGARLYDPAVGSFVSADSVDDGENPFAYAHHNPLRFVDPTGHDGQDTKKTQSPPPAPPGTAARVAEGVKDWFVGAALGTIDPIGGLINLVGHDVPTAASYYWNTPAGEVWRDVKEVVSDPQTGTMLGLTIAATAAGLRGGGLLGTRGGAAAAGPVLRSLEVLPTRQGQLLLTRMELVDGRVVEVMTTARRLPDGRVEVSLARAMPEDWVPGSKNMKNELGPREMLRAVREQQQKIFDLYPDIDQFSLRFRRLTESEGGSTGFNRPTRETVRTIRRRE